MVNGEEVLYVFCFARSDGVLDIQGSGVDDHHPLWIFHHSPELCAVLSHVAAEEFCGPAAERQMQELTWVGPRAFRHEAVIEEVMALSPVLPVRFGTLFSSLKALTEFMDTHRETILEFLLRVSGHGEWSVKGLLNRTLAQHRVLSSCLSAQQEQLSAMAEGMRYFAEQRIRNHAQTEVSGWLEQTSRQVARDLAGHALEFRECKVVSHQATESGIEEVLNWAFLLPSSALTAFQQRLDRANLDLGQQGLLFELSGPWPPFRFVPALSVAGTP
ncbi:MAG: GvpL/GvpF family gas vesicle protein [Candidatus Korobacteraceae bacterium]|jgi:gas vesicle protein GvpL/GvpF